ncbi:indole-3-glycerol phosphate synthase TrpC [Neisseria sp. Ec49-e6-T10]|uniref:indole-3-glycerol phosphate synthase TrpC n=1 Tax=Neisseria sp. Ec49-e6-T10 TaxID=3140744 RepID=UPI003EB73BEC
MADILEKILQTKKLEVAEQKASLSLQAIQNQLTHAPKVRDFLSAIKQKHAINKPAIIAEIKKASPSKGIIREDFDPAVLAKLYAQNGAACLSVLTDKPYFMGAPEYLIAAREACDLPVLRKDFIVDEYQIYQARSWGADAILLIAAALTEQQLLDFEKIAQSLDMSVLVEVHNKEEFEKCSLLNTELIGINNRNLRTFDVDLNTTLSLKTDIPNKIIVTESGIKTTEDMEMMQANGVHTFLIGEQFMKQVDPGKALRELYEK